MLGLRALRGAATPVTEAGPSRYLTSIAFTSHSRPLRPTSIASLSRTPARLQLAIWQPDVTVSSSSYRYFHPSRRRQDVFFVAFPALKSGLLNVTRFTLLFLPFIFRYRLWRKYRKTSYLLIQIPIFALCIVFALGLDQSPKTGRWRLLLMSEKEELAWSRRKQREVLKADGPLILPPTDDRSQRVTLVASRLITALEEQEGHIICGAAGSLSAHPEGDPGALVSEREVWEAKNLEERYKPSGVATSSYMPFRPQSSNPLKVLESADWKMYVIDLPNMNAFALPSKDIFVYTGLLNTLPDDDAMLAAVLAHEIAHVAERHSVENLGFLNVAAVAFDVLRGISFALTISFPFITDSAGVFINWLNDVVAQRAYSRKLEVEADAYGIDLMATAGYDPRAALDLWEFMHAVEVDAQAAGTSNQGIEDRFALLRTHPTSLDRQKALEKDLEGAMRLWKQSRPEQKRAAMMMRLKAEAATGSPAIESSKDRPVDAKVPSAARESEARVQTVGGDARSV